MIRQFERQVAAYQNYIVQLTGRYETLLEEHTKSIEEDKDTLLNLNANFRDKIGQAADLVHHICGRYAVFEIEHSKWQEREKELNESKRQMEERLKKENEALVDQLNALEEFRANRDMLMLHYAELVTRLERIKNDHVTALHNLSARDAAYRARLKKATQRKLDKVTAEFRQQSYELTEPTFKRMLGESVSIKVQLVKLSSATMAMTEENTTMKKEFQQLLSEQSRLKEDQESICVRSSAIMKLTYLLAIHKKEVEDLISTKRIEKQTKDKLANECARLREEIARTEKYITSKSRRIAHKKKKYHILRETIQSQTSDVQLLLDCLNDASQSIKMLLGSINSEDDEENVKKATVRTVQDILTGLSRVKTLMVNSREEPSSRRTVQTISDSLLTDKSSQSRRGNDPLELLINNPADDMESDISAPNSSYEEDLDMEISEPEEEIDRASELLRQMSKTSEKTQVSQSVRSGRIIESEQRDTTGERLDLLWSRICRSPLDAYLPGSRPWRELLSYLAKNIKFWTVRMNDEPREHVYLRLGDLGLVPKSDKVILTKKQIMDAAQRLGTGCEQAGTNSTVDEHGSAAGTTCSTAKTRSVSVGIMARSCASLNEFRLAKI
ncbi:hypothetical protein FGIG_05534 [Fasciola gigantica]|uniref:Cilia- and flagella-associated protein 157 n=1 Tax=Fasciola gigantica TaxID=46835 RepID=A0A504YDC5_FASGI|nr:hypothetical protein FGIG_05534 [Fasciola gigantica]